MIAEPTREKFLRVAAGLLMLAATGAQCPRRPPPTVTSPIVFHAVPSMDQVIQVVNANTSRVRQLQADRGKLTVQGAPSLQASLALERPLRFRLRGETVITGSELDLGSNDELFWLWARRGQPPAVYFARHTEFTPGYNGILPLPPTWLIEALGLVELDTFAHYEGPFTAGPGQFEVRYMTNGTPMLAKAMVLDAQRGVILQQRVYDVTGQLLAAAHLSEHQFDPTSGASLPRKVSVQLPPADIAFTFETDGYQVNNLYADPATLWAMPQISNATYRDISK